MSQHASDTSSSNRLIVHNLVKGEAHAAFAEDVRAGLSARPKYLLPKYFYDPLGSLLFEAICLLPEYYLTRAENEIMARKIDEITGALQTDSKHLTRLLEMGSGSATKTRLIVEAILKRQAKLLYIPVDISASALETSSLVLLQSFPGLSVEAYASDYYTALAALGEKEGQGQTLALFLGSNIGNFGVEEAHEFLRALRRVLRPGDALLLGADLKKEASKLEAAYDDSLGVTAAFNLNLLARINRELNADFDLRGFRHVAIYSEESGRIDAYLESRRAQIAHIAGLEMEINFTAGERIHTESSHKYDAADLERLATSTGFTRERVWLDRAEQFSSNLFVAI